MSKLENIFEQVLASAARVREIKQVRYESIEMGTYELNQYKKIATPHAIAETEIRSGVVGRDYMLIAVSQTNKRNKEHNRTKRR